MSCCSFDGIMFLGCHVQNVNCNLAFGGGSTSMSISLLEPCNGAYNGSLGCLYTFNLGGLTFNGILIDHKYSANSGGFAWDIKLSDGRENLSSVQVITAQYYCNNIPVPNIINALAELEPSVCNLGCADFMKSFKDERGMPMLFILRAIHLKTCVLPVCGVQLLIDVSNVIAICPTYYKITDGTIDVMRAIEQACNEAGFDFFVEIIGNSFVVQVINKRIPPVPGALRAHMAAMAAANAGAQTTYLYGQVVSHEPSKKFVFGDSIHYLQTIEDDECDNGKPEEDTEPVGGGIIGGNPGKIEDGWGGGSSDIAGLVPTIEYPPVE